MPRVPNIAIVTAAHVNNSGMYSVDLSAIEFFSGQSCNFKMFSVQMRNGNERQHGKIHTTKLQSIEQLRDFDTLVYWGDFLNNPVYGNEDFRRKELRFGHSANRKEAFEKWMKFFTLSEGKPIKRVLSIGNNFQHDFTAEKKYLTALKNLESNFDLILPRDHFSFQNLSRHFAYSAMSKIQAGMDCAFLLKPIKEETTDSSIFTYQFGRSGLDNIDELVSRIENITNLKGVPLSKWLDLRAPIASETFDKQRKQIKASRFVLTDIYHLSINTITLQTPIVALGAKQTSQTGTLGDFKKKMLFQMLDLSDRYFEFDRNALDNASEISESLREVLGTE